MNTHHSRIKSTAEDKVFNVLVLFFSVIVLICTVYPFYYVIIMSFNDGYDSLRGGIFFWPRQFTLSNYTQFLTDSKWLHGILITVAKTVVGATLTVLFTCMVAYGLSMKELLFKKTYNVILLICMYFSGGLIPYYLTMMSYGILDTFWVYVIPTMFSTYYCILAASFFKEIPASIGESARLDGAGELTIFFRFVLPLSKALLATLALFAAVSQWNSWTDTAFYTPGNKSLRTLAFLLRDVIVRNQTATASRQTMMHAAEDLHTTSSSVQMAAMIIAVLPITCVYPFLQKYFVKGIMLGAVKG
ncbi:MAG: carbohydrate ABC transporter permease [Clostridia bacterium]